METTSVVIVTHDSARFIEPVLEALIGDPDGPDEVIVVDSASSDDTRDLVAAFDVGQVDLDDNVGFAAGCHIGAERASGSVLVFLGHDTVPEHGWLPPLVDAACLDGVGAAMATILDADDPTTFNNAGGHLTYVGLAWVTGLGEPVPPDEPDVVEVAFPSGAALAIRAEVWRRFGGFRRSLFMYHEDTDLGWRLRLAGLRVVRATRSRVRHHYDFARTPTKMYHLERNRWTLLLTNYHRSTVLILMPAFVVADLGVWFVAVRDGWARSKIRAMRDLRGRRAERRDERRLVEANRRITDAAMLASMDTGVSEVRQVAPPKGSGVVDGVLAGYLRVALPLVRLAGRRSELATPPV